MSAVISKATIGFLSVIQFLIFMIFIFLVKYPGQNTPPMEKSNIIPQPVEAIDSPLPVMATGTYSMFQHIHVMVFIGFGFLMTYLRKYGRSSVSFTLLLSCLVIMWYLVIDGLIYSQDESIYLTLESIIKADEAAATFLISFGAVLGKFNILQFYVMAFIETAVYAANKYLIDEVLLAADAGGSMIIHEFGAFFGLGVSLVLGLKDGIEEEKSDQEKSSYESDIFSMIGTLFLWVFWPSFNGLLIVETERFRAIMNTYIALASSCTVVAIFVIIFSKNKEWKMGMVYIQNATLAAGVAIGSSANLKIYPWQAMLIGSIGGIISVISYYYIQYFLYRKLRMHDTCGVFSLHGFPGTVGGFIGALMVHLATEKVYGFELYAIYPAMSPFKKNRSRLSQAGFQICSLICCMTIGFAGGFLTGLLIVLTIPNLTKEERFVDETHWEGY